MDALTLDSILPSIEGKTVTLFGDLSKKRNMFIKQFIFDGFKKGETVCIVTLITSAFDLIEELSSFYPDAGMDVNEAIFNENLQIIDMYSFRGHETEENVPGTHVLESAKDLTMLSIKLNQISKEFDNVRFVIWPYSLLSIYTNQVDLVNFTQTFSARLSSRKQIGLLIADSGVMNEQQRNIIESIVDSVIETRKTEKDNKIEEVFRVKFFKGSDNYKFETWTTMT